MRKIFPTLIIALAVMLGWQTAHAHHPREARVEVWTAQCHDDGYDAERTEVFLRLSERGYVTIYQITHFGNVEILYPRPHHHQHELRADRIYRLVDLADDVCLYDDVEGDAQIGVIFTPEPVVLAPWLERSFVEAGLVIGRNKFIYAHCDFPRVFARVEADIRIHLGARCAPVFVATPVYVRPRVVYRQPDWDRGHWRPHPDYKKRDHGRRGYDYEPPHTREEYVPKPRMEEKREPEVRRVTFTARPAERKEEPVIVPPSRRERKEAPAQKQAGETEKKRPSSRRGHEKRAND